VDRDRRRDRVEASVVLCHTLRCRVTEVVPGERIDYEVLGGIDARGHWAIKPVSDPPGGCDAASRARLVIEFDASNSGSTKRRGRSDHPPTPGTPTTPDRQPPTAH